MQAITQLLIDQPELMVLTATSRLSRRLLHEYNQQQMASGLAAWPTPDILSWSAWIQRQWQTLALASDSGHVALSSTQSLHVWQAVIEEDTDQLLNVQATARQAQTARQQVIDYTLDLTEDSNRQWFVYDIDASKWLDWHQQYEHTLSENSWLDAPAITQHLIQQITSNQLPVSRPLCLVGFDALTPLQQQLQSWLTDHKRWVASPIDERVAGEAVLNSANDPQHEIEQAAHWAREQFENWQAGDEPIGIIVPKLERSRQQVERIFRAVFYPEDGMQTLSEQSLHTQGLREESVFNISMGYSLKQEPVIDTVLKLLTLCRRSFQFEDFSQVLRSPFIIDAQDQRSARSALDNYLRQRSSSELSLHALIDSLPAEGAEAIHQLLSDLSSMKQNWQHKASAQTWVTCFQQCLSLFGLLRGDEVYQTTYQYQVMQSLEEVWFEFSRIELVKDKLTLEQAITTFTQMVNSQIFQSGAGELPVQILGVIEAAGMQFSSLRVIGMTEQNWPPPANPNPFIPLRLQRQCSMPHCSPQREFDYAMQQTQRLLHAANFIVFSYPQYDGEEALVMSPLVADFPLQSYTIKVAQAIEIPAFDSLQDVQGPVVDVTQYQAGSGALKDQSQCPFRAFVVHRLNSKLPEEPQPGNDPRLRGNLVHKVMELLWQRWQTSGHLHALCEADRHQAVRQAIDEVIQSVWSGSNREHEAKRLFNIINEWLEEELQRQPFQVISTEQKLTTVINRLRLRLVIDRIDELADGSHCVVDYKTGPAKTGDWTGDRPDEPQLPLYALTQSTEVNAVTFANIRAGESKYIGVTRDQALMAVDAKALKGVKQIPVTKGVSSLKLYESWEAMMVAWQTIIYRLADEHINGDARVDPKNNPGTCTYCDVNPVCRLFDWQEEAGEEV